MYTHTYVVYTYTFLHTVQICLSKVIWGYSCYFPFLLSQVRWGTTPAAWDHGQLWVWTAMPRPPRGPALRPLQGPWSSGQHEVSWGRVRGTFLLIHLSSLSSHLFMSVASCIFIPLYIPLPVKLFIPRCSTVIGVYCRYYLPSSCGFLCCPLEILVNCCTQMASQPFSNQGVNW